jgi:hypothetical protein
MTYLSLAWLIIFKASPWHVEEHRLEEESEADPLVVLVADRLLPLTLVANSWVSGQAVIVIQDSLGQSERWMNPKCNLQFKLRQTLLKAFLVVLIKKLNRLNQNYVRVQCIKVENKLENDKTWIDRWTDQQYVSIMLAGTSLVTMQSMGSPMNCDAVTTNENVTRIVTVNFEWSLKQKT